MPDWFAAPPRVRGLKCCCFLCKMGNPRSHPAWGAWIEIQNGRGALCRTGSHPAWGAWIEIVMCPIVVTFVALSHPAWGAWIEICKGR